jgi:hypothetical protein
MVQRGLRLLLIAYVTIIFGAHDARSDDKAPNRPEPTFSETPKQEVLRQPQTLAELLALPPERLEKVDIALIDLLCAEGLPGAENLDVKDCLATLDRWASVVKAETERNAHRFAEHPEKFKNSLGRYRMAIMEAVLSQDFQVQYNPERAKELADSHYFAQGEPLSSGDLSFFSDSKDFFLHGLLADRHFGTCASMPYLYVALGRRLGYPVSIAATHMHSYVYYDEGNGNHFNVEATETRGFFTPTDQQYRNPPWGAPLSPECFETMGLLKPLSNREAMGHLLATRAGVYRSAGRHDEEAKTWEIAPRYFPDTPTWRRIADNMQHCAKRDEYHKWRDGVWKDLAARYIPRGPGFAYFLDKKIKLHLFMNECLDRKAIEGAADAYKKELAEYAKVAMIDPKLASDHPLPQSTPLTFCYRPPDGPDVRIPADWMPPYPAGALPLEAQRRLAVAKPQDADGLLEILWTQYAEAQELKHAKEKAELERIMSGNPVLISEESIPLEFRQGVPMDLAFRLSGLHKAEDIVAEMMAYKCEQEARQAHMSFNPMARTDAALRVVGRPGTSEAPGTPYSSRGFAGVPGMDSSGRIDPYSANPALQKLVAEGMIPGPDGRTLSSKEVMDRRIQQQNEMLMNQSMQLRRAPSAQSLGMVLPYQVVPASVAAGNPAVENPMPYQSVLQNANPATQNNGL